MENKKIIYGLSTGILIILIISITQINFLNNTVKSLEDNLTEIKNDNEEKNTLIKDLQKQIEELTHEASEIEAELNNSKNNNTLLMENIIEMNNTINDLQSDLQLMDDAVNIIGRGEIATILQNYGETEARLEELEGQYYQLLRNYNVLLEQLENN
jgi:chromosome segregation ATPase